MPHMPHSSRHHKAEAKFNVTTECPYFSSPTLPLTHLLSSPTSRSPCRSRYRQHRPRKICYLSWSTYQLGHRWRSPSPCRLFRWERNGGQIAHRQWCRCKRSKVCLPCFPASFPLFFFMNCRVLGTPSTSRVRYNLSASFYRATIHSPKFKVNADSHILPLDYPVVSLTRRAAPRLP